MSDKANIATVHILIESPQHCRDFVLIIPDPACCSTFIVLHCLYVMSLVKNSLPTVSSVTSLK